MLPLVYVTIMQHDFLALLRRLAAGRHGKSSSTCLIKGATDDVRALVWMMKYILTKACTGINFCTYCTT